MADFDGHFQARGSVRLKRIQKPPRRRFNPGNIVEIQQTREPLTKGERYVVQYAFRLAAEPSEWVYSLGKIEPGREDRLGGLLAAIGAGEKTPRVVADGGFVSEFDVYTYFFDIVCARLNVHVTNRTMMAAKATIVTEVLKTETPAIPEVSSEPKIVEGTIENKEDE